MITSVIIGYFVSIALVFSPFYKSRANNYLALSLFLISSLTFLESPRVSMDNMFFQFLNNIRLDFLFAPTLFTYFLIQIRHPLLKSKRYKWMFLAFIIPVIFEVFISFFDYILNIYSYIFDVFVYLTIDALSISFNLFLTFFARNLIRKSITISKDKRHWLLRLNLFITCIIIIWVLTRIEIYLFNSAYIVYIIWILMSLFSWWVLYYGVFKLQVIAQKDEIHEYLLAQKKPKNKPNNKVNSATSSKIITQLYMLMEDEELFKNPLLSRLELANQLGTSESYLSQIVNQELNKSIIQFVNEYRVMSAKNLLQDPVFDKYSVEAIGLEAGFKSKSAFYNAFKTHLQQSPGAYRKLERTS